VGEATVAGAHRLIASGPAIRDVGRLTAQYGRQAVDWVKLSTRGVSPSALQSYAQQAGRGAKIEIHYYGNKATELVVELKSVFSSVIQGKF
jgi:hypothetical protein